MVESQSAAWCRAPSNPACGLILMQPRYCHIGSCHIGDKTKQDCFFLKSTAGPVCFCSHEQFWTGMHRDRRSTHPAFCRFQITQDLSATRTNRYARFSRREARCRRLPAAFRKLAGDFRLLRGLAPGAGPTTTEPLRAASCLCLFLAIAADALLSQGKSVLVGSREKSERKRS